MKCYDSIDTLPVFNWSKVHTDNDLKWLLITDKKINKRTAKHLETVWKKIYNEYIERFGFSENFLKIIRKQKEIARLKVKKIVDEDRGQITFIQIAEKELDELMKSTHSESHFFSSKPAMEKILGFQIDIKKTTVAEWYEYIKSVELMAKAA